MRVAEDRHGPLQLERLAAERGQIPAGVGLKHLGADAQDLGGVGRAAELLAPEEGARQVEEEVVRVDAEHIPPLEQLRSRALGAAHRALVALGPARAERRGELGKLSLDHADRFRLPGDGLLLAEDREQRAADERRAAGLSGQDDPVQGLRASGRPGQPVGGEAVSEPHDLLDVGGDQPLEVGPGQQDR